MQVNFVANLSSLPVEHSPISLLALLQVYYATPMNRSEVKGCWCHPCYQDHRGERIELDGTQVCSIHLMLAQFQQLLAVLLPRIKLAISTMT